MPPKPATFQEPIDNSPELEALLFVTKENGETQENLLETSIFQNEKNSKEVKETIEKGSKQVVEAVEDLKPSIKEMEGPVSAIAKFLKDMKGDPGENGTTPKKGKDYFTPEEVESFKQEIQEGIRVPEDGYTPVKGKDYFDGEPGKTPKKGKDYFTEEEIEAIKRAVKPLKGIDYRDGKDADVDYDLVIEAVMRKMSKPKKGKEKSLPTIEEIIKKVKEELKYSDIKDAPEWKTGSSSRDYDLVELKDVNITNPTNGQTLIYNSTTGKWENGTGGGGAGYTLVDEEVPSGSIDDVNVTFTLAHTPVVGSVHLYMGVRLKRGTDYSISGATITMFSAPLVGSTLVADYRYT